MKRRDLRVTVDPPAKLLAYAAADWLALVDVAAYDPDRFRGVTDGEPHGEPSRTLEQWTGDQAWTLWLGARLAWHKQHGWPGGLGHLDMLVDSLAAKRALV